MLNRSEFKERMSRRGRYGAEVRWKNYHDTVGPRNYPPNLPSDCFRITIDNLVTGQSHEVVFHPSSRRGRYLIDVDGKPWQESLAVAACVKVQQISLWETGMGTPNMKSLEKICTALDCPPKFFFVAK